MKLVEKVIKSKILKLLDKRKKEKMNQYKFDGAFINEVMDFMNEDKQEENKDKENEEVKLTDYNGLFNN